MDFLGTARKHRFILAAALLSVIVFSALFPYQSVFPDEEDIFSLGKGLSQDLLYYKVSNDPPNEFCYFTNNWHRMPLMPLMFAGAFAAGADIPTARFIIPLVFFVLGIMSAYFLAREVGGEDMGRIATLALLATPFFWRWGVRSMADIPLIFLTCLLLYLFFRDQKGDNNILYMGPVIALGTLLKPTFLIIPAVMVVYWALKKREVFRRQDLWISAALMALVLGAFFVAFGMGQIADTCNTMRDDYIYKFNPVESAANRVIDWDRNVIYQVISGAEYSSAYELFKLSMFPLSLFALLGIYSYWTRGRRFLVYCLAAFVAFMFIFWVIRIRNFAPLYPIVAIFIAEGFYWLRKRLTRDIVTAVFILLLALSFAGSAFLLSLDWQASVGSYELAEYAKGLEGRVASDYFPESLGVSGSIILLDAYELAMLDGDLEKVLEGNPRYVIISAYGEFYRSPTKDTYHPDFFGLFEIPFITRPYTVERPPPDMGFHSDMYLELEENYERHDELYVGDRLTFLVYDVSTSSS